MLRTRTLIMSPLLLACAFSGSGIAQSMPPHLEEGTNVPAFHAKPPASAEKLSPILRPDQLSSDSQRHPFVARAYLIAARIHRTLYQLPCYCHCDQTVGHTSLRSCYADDHASHCAACLQELFYADQMLKQGKTAKEIRAGIEHGDFQQVDLNKV